MVEVCVFSVESCRNAQNAEAKRVELCTSMPEGGLTPSYGLIKAAREVLHTTKLYVMIRPRGGDFCYTPDELACMKSDIEMAKSLGADGLVFGILTPEGEVDIERNKILVELSKPLPLTFHRAFDMTLNPFKALENLIELGFENVLTSGQQATAYEGIRLIDALSREARGRINIMAGSGVNAQNAKNLIQAGADALHLSAKTTRIGLMTYQKKGISMGGNNPSEYEVVYADESKIRAVVEVMMNDKN